jgi:hypothetical protein
MKRSPLPPRKTPLRSTTRPARRTRVKPVNRKRKAANLERAHGPVTRREWIKTLACSNCGAVGYSVGAHIKNGGAGRKADARFTIPLCHSRDGIEGCHELQHRVGWSALARLAPAKFREISAATIEEIWQMELRYRAGQRRSKRLDDLLASLGID